MKSDVNSGSGSRWKNSKAKILVKRCTKGGKTQKQSMTGALSENKNLYAASNSSK